MIEKNAKMFVAGHTGLLGSALVRKLQSVEYCNIGCGGMDFEDRGE